VKRTILVLVACLGLLLAAEVWLRGNLFRYVSYSNSESIDVQLRDRDREGPWHMLFVGDSEVRWGLNPEQVDRGLTEGGATARSFNHAFDGFGASWWTVLLPRVLQSPALADVQTVAIGVQMIEVHQVLTPTRDHCGALQRPVLTSAFGIDNGLDGLCQSRAWDSQLGRQMFAPLWSVRYASAVRTLLMPEAVSVTPMLQFNSRKAGKPLRGFQPHRSIEQDEKEAYAEFGRWKAQFNPERDFNPLPPQAWEQMVAEGGFFDEVNSIVSRSERRLVLFALPTNPLAIDTFQRRADYARNSRLLSQWAANQRVTFIDLGIQDRPDAAMYFSDMRHLSGYGAADFSLRLGRAFAPFMDIGQRSADVPSVQGPLCMSTARIGVTQPVDGTVQLNGESSPQSHTSTLTVRKLQP